MECKNAMLSREFFKVPGNEQNKQWRLTPSKLLFNNQLFYILSYEVTSNSKEETQQSCIASEIDQK
jgi:hypothetical protein